MKLRTLKLSCIVVMLAAMLLPAGSATADTEGETVVVQDQITIFAHKDVTRNLTDGADMQTVLEEATRAAEGFLAYTDEVLEAPFEEEATVYLFPDAETRLQGMMDNAGIDEEQARNRLNMHGDSQGSISTISSDTNSIWSRLNNPHAHITRQEWTGNHKKIIIHELLHLWEFSQLQYNPSQENARPSSLIVTEGVAEQTAYNVLFREKMSTPENICQGPCQYQIDKFYPDNFPEVENFGSRDEWVRLTRELRGAQYLLAGLYLAYLHDAYNPRGVVEYYQFINQGFDAEQAVELAFGVEPSFQDPNFPEFIAEFFRL